MNEINCLNPFEIREGLKQYLMRRPRTKFCLNPFEIREGLKRLALEMCCKSMACRGLYG